MRRAAVRWERFRRGVQRVCRPPSRPKAILRHHPRCSYRLLGHSRVLHHQEPKWHRWLLGHLPLAVRHCKALLRLWELALSLLSRVPLDSHLRVIPRIGPAHSPLLRMPDRRVSLSTNRRRLLRALSRPQTFPLAGMPRVFSPPRPARRCRQHPTRVCLRWPHLPLRCHQPKPTRKTLWSLASAHW